MGKSLNFCFFFFFHFNRFLQESLGKGVLDSQGKIPFISPFERAAWTCHLNSWWLCKNPQVHHWLLKRECILLHLVLLQMCDLLVWKFWFPCLSQGARGNEVRPGGLNLVWPWLQTETTEKSPPRDVPWRPPFPRRVTSGRCSAPEFQSCPIKGGVMKPSQSEVNEVIN